MSWCSHIIICRYVTDSAFVKQMFHIQTELINNAYPKMGITMYSEIIDNGTLLFFASFGDFERFFENYLEFNKKGFNFLIQSKKCSPDTLEGKLVTSIQITVELTASEVPKEKIIDHINSIYEKVAGYIVNSCCWGKKCNCIKVKRVNPTSMTVNLQREEELREILSLIPFDKKYKKICKD
ncbi:MAG: hypothetical protein RBG13Loki_1818 [Promethearchaeota archaeon CR_4]|nr:MAG: hypothetical protein RBG13Loki_1818 [Candidatus Lokiarchaeota archaeon CR_4]